MNVAAKTTERIELEHANWPDMTCVDGEECKNTDLHRAELTSVVHCQLDSRERQTSDDSSTRGTLEGLRQRSRYC